jgi:hypothetical protein
LAAGNTSFAVLRQEVELVSVLQRARHEASDVSFRILCKPSLLN